MGMLRERPVLIGERIRELRERAGLTQEQLGERIGQSGGAHVNMMERGKRQNVETWVVALLAEELDTSMDYLLGLTRDPTRYPTASRLSVDEAVRRVLLLKPDARDTLAEFLRLLQSPSRGSDAESPGMQ